ncbi:MAG: isoprenylcysteine carboxylmethyltransferase family protein [Brevundimonas sp.]|uniref:isoprenylcysteine carboxyl methyltransferase family protein n=1 Tax=Brevundimonas sp. TaxID=1871086 RepID=UPI00248A86AF|nr:isoprenylcysteine carboxylmethyltransferase family protein [Brevundimonas sp.]MDI1327449.1 isoprenylcysteine carboxylmethyltransferase family protein [Brevundimonas sp.]
MMWLWLVLGLVAAQRLWELWLADRNTKRLLAEGAVEVGAAHYPLFVILHASWLAAIAIVTPWTTIPNLWWLAFYFALQFGRLWVISTLGRFWTTRIITLPGAPLEARGPYRIIRHPNYVVASLEILVLPLAFGQVWIALVWSVANALLVAWRIRIEDRALQDRRS